MGILLSFLSGALRVSEHLGSVDRSESVNVAPWPGGKELLMEGPSWPMRLIVRRSQRGHDVCMTAQQPTPRVTGHAVDRYRQRVEMVHPAVAARRLAQMASASTRRPTPRHWTNVSPNPGVLFLYPHDNSDVCLVVKDDAIVTVFSRVVCLLWRTGAETSSPAARREPYRRPAPGALPLEAA